MAAVGGALCSRCIARCGRWCGPASKMTAMWVPPCSSSRAGEHVGEAVDGVDRCAVLPGHGRQRVKGAEDKARAVNQDKMGFYGRGCIGHVSDRGRPRRRARGGRMMEQYGQKVCSCSMCSQTRGWPSGPASPSQGTLRLCATRTSVSPTPGVGVEAPERHRSSLELQRRGHDSAPRPSLKLRPGQGEHRDDSLGR